MYLNVLSRLQYSVKWLVLLCHLKLSQFIIRKHDYRAAKLKLYALSYKHVFLHYILTLLIFFLVTLHIWKRDNIVLSQTSLSQDTLHLPLIGGGSGRQCLSSKELEQFIHPEYRDILACSEGVWSFDDHVLFTNIPNNTTNDRPMIAAFLPFDSLKHCVNAKELSRIATKHGLERSSRKSRSTLEGELYNHECSARCMSYCSLFVACKPKDVKTTEDIDDKYVQENIPFSTITKDNKTIIDTSLEITEKSIKFPPKPPSKELLRKIINGFIADTSPEVFIEEGYACCGSLRPVRQLTLLTKIACTLTPLIVSGVTRKERRSSTDPIEDIAGPVLDKSCDKICSYCLKYLKKGKKPPFSLASGFWIGEIPKELECLTYAEKLLISRVRHNRCIIKVASGRYKMRANAIMFKHPTPKIYQTLPPPSKEFDEVLAVIFTGPCKPTQEDIQRTPFLVR